MALASAQTTYYKVPCAKSLKQTFSHLDDVMQKRVFIVSDRHFYNN